MFDKTDIDSVIQSLSKEEKVNLVMGTGMDLGSNTPAVGLIKKNRVPGAAGSTYDIKDKGIPSIVLADGPAGLRILPTRKESADKTYYGTAFPIASLLASSWDTKLVQNVGEAMGEETKEYGVDILLAPALNIHRYALGGRNFEYFSEDPLVSGKMAAAIVNGVQSKGVGTSIKHFVANNHEWNRSTIDVLADQRALRELYLRGFEIAIKESKPWTVMSSYNKLNGEYTSESNALLTKILRDQWGFDGVVMTDWFGGEDAAKQMRAGNDLLMPGTVAQRENLLKALEDGTLEEETLDKNIRNILKIIGQSQTYSGYQYSDTPDLKSNAEIARSAASEGIVLLKNNNNTLPISSSQRLAVFGNHSYDMVTGGTGSGDVNEAYVISLEQGLNNAGIQIDSSLPWKYKSHIKTEKAKIPPFKSPIDAFKPKKPLPQLELTNSKIQQLANDLDAALITIGRSSGEFEDRKQEDFYLTDKETQLIENVSEAFREQSKPVIAILNIGGVIEMASWVDKVDAILLAYQPGQEAGNAIADVLTGTVNPSGKLIDTFPIDLQDYPAHEGFPGVVTGEAANPKFIMGTPPSQVSYDDGIWVGYRYFNTENHKVVYPFGFGQSYTSFKYSDLKLGTKTFDGQLDIAVTVTNTGTVAGKEVVQIYVQAPKGNLEKPSQELRAFGKTRLLEPNESQTLTFTLKPRDLSSFDTEQQNWVVEKGKYKVMAAASSRDIKKNRTFKVKTEMRLDP